MGDRWTPRVGMRKKLPKMIQAPFCFVFRLGLSSKHLLQIKCIKVIWTLFSFLKSSSRFTTIKPHRTKCKADWAFFTQSMRKFSSICVNDFKTHLERRLCSCKPEIGISNVYLRCKVFWRPAERFHCGSVLDPFLTEPKICDLYMSVFVQHEVFQL